MDHKNEQNTEVQIQFSTKRRQKETNNNKQEMDQAEYRFNKLKNAGISHDA